MVIPRSMRRSRPTAEELGFSGDLAQVLASGTSLPRRRQPQPQQRQQQEQEQGEEQEAGNDATTTDGNDSGVRRSNGGGDGGVVVGVARARLGMMASAAELGFDSESLEGLLSRPNPSHAPAPAPGGTAAVEPDRPTPNREEGGPSGYAALLAAEQQRSIQRQQDAAATLAAQEVLLLLHICTSQWDTPQPASPLLRTLTLSPLRAVAPS